MSLVEKAAYLLINGKRTITKPIFLKEFSKDNKQLNDLMELSKNLPKDKKVFIDRDINLLKQGMDGEENVYYELKNSFIPMVCLHDIRLEYNDYVAQFDFIIITNKLIYVLETKKLNGDIEITQDGDFIRNIKNHYGKIIKKEGMYSPISQNERHVNILKEVLTKERLIRTMPIKSAVVIASPKSIINKAKCPRVISKSICKYDQLTNLLKRDLNDKSNDMDMLEKFIYEIADYLIKNDKPATFDYMAKYSLDENSFADVEVTMDSAAELPLEKSVQNLPGENVPKANSATNSPFYEELRQFRYSKSKEQGIKPYFVFTNQELEAVIAAMPKSNEELFKINGFGEKKVEKYGDGILEIVNKWR